MHQVGKYSPTRFSTLDVPIEVLAMVNKSTTSRAEPDSASKARATDAFARLTPDGTFPPPGAAKMRISKGAKVKAVRRHPSPQPASLESLEAAWSESGERARRRADGTSSPARYPDASKPADASEPQVNGQGGGQPPRGRKRVLHPDVRTIFSPAKDPRVKEETGEGHCFVAGVPATWCDLCCRYIIHDGRICSGCKYTCHAECQHRVALDCQPGPGSTPETHYTSLSQDQLNNNTQLTDYCVWRKRGKWTGPLCLPRQTQGSRKRTAVDCS